MFTALFMTRFFFSKWVENPNHKQLNMLDWFKAKDFNFFKYAKPVLFISSCVILVGSFVLITQRNTIIGMDFRGGHALTVELTPHAKENYRQSVEQALIHAGATNNEMQIRELTPNNQVRIFLSRSLQEEGHPFANLPLEYPLKESNYSYQTNPKIVWVVQSLEQEGLSLTPSSLQNLNKQWTDVSGQLSNTMRNNALIGIGIAIVGFLVVSFTDYRRLIEMAPIFYVGGLLLLFLVLTPLGVEVNGQKAWVRIFGLQFQPSEFAKIPTALMLAKYFGAKKGGLLSLREMLVGGAIFVDDFGNKPTSFISTTTAIPFSSTISFHEVQTS